MGSDFLPMLIVFGVPLACIAIAKVQDWRKGRKRKRDSDAFLKRIEVAEGSNYIRAICLDCLEEVPLDEIFSMFHKYCGGVVPLVSRELSDPQAREKVDREIFRLQTDPMYLSEQRRKYARLKKNGDSYRGYNEKRG